MGRVRGRRHWGVALHAESVDRNVAPSGRVSGSTPSLSMRRAWIEIPRPVRRPPESFVALHAESVDRNNGLMSEKLELTQVALHAESVDRNFVVRGRQYE